VIVAAKSRLFTADEAWKSQASFPEVTKEIWQKRDFVSRWGRECVLALQLAAL